ncbi:MerR family transcriptional regulator [Microbulbifer flavimaris]|uniref:MerR family transcriptional regulator n=1 Tax=Microbulbifer flavimaris TaxID=1781068 RepID=A0ABX4HXS0_9GAMM|nr:MerR family transcriptional regulator [Microbulbifer flavimaris]
MSEAEVPTPAAARGEKPSGETEQPLTESNLAIGEVAQRTGVNPVTLRAWERRYGLLVPSRTGKGHRLYSESDVARIRDIQAWLARGVAIGKVRPLLEQSRGDSPPADAAGLEPTPVEDSWSQLVAETLALEGRLVPAELDRHLEQLLSAYPLPLLLDRWLSPLQRRLSRQRRYGSSIARALFWRHLGELLAVNLRAGRRNRKRGPVLGRLVLLTFPGTEQGVFAQLFEAALTDIGFEVIGLAPEAELGELAIAEKTLGIDGVLCYSHHALPMATLGSGLERARKGLRVPLWFAGGFVDLQQQDLCRLAERARMRLLSANCTEALQQLREQFS